jgi:hypothetical protein
MEGPLVRAALFLCWSHCERRRRAAIQELELACFATLAMTKLILAFAIVLAGCGKEKPAAPTAEQSAQLNDAENMLNEAAANGTGNFD